MKTVLASVVMPQQGVVYFAQDRDGRVKIGWTADLRRRLAGLESTLGYGLHLIRTVDGSKVIEAWFHKRFAQHRIRGEWFCFAPEMLTVPVPDECPIVKVCKLSPAPTIQDLREAGRFFGMSDLPAFKALLAAQSEVST